MVKIIPKSKETIIGEEHLFTIMFGLEDVLEVYKTNLNKLNKIDYNDMNAQEAYLQKHYENKIYDVEQLLKDIKLGIENVTN